MTGCHVPLTLSPWEGDEQSVGAGRFEGEVSQGGPLLQPTVGEHQSIPVSFERGSVVYERSNSSIRTLSGPRTKAILTPGRMVFGSTAKSAPRRFNSA
jgi:hypothetical protein